MADSPENTDLDKLQDRIRSARGQGVPAEGQAQENTPMPMSRIGFDFLATILGSAIFGWLIDKAFDSRPWGMIGVLALGFCAGIIGVWRAMMAGDAVVADKKGK